MTRKIILRDTNGKEYTLEFNRATVERMQRQGFVLDTERLLLCVKGLVTGAFQMHHKGMTWERIEPIWMAQTGRKELMVELANMYSAPMLDLIGVDENGEDAGNENPTWTAME